MMSLPSRAMVRSASERQSAPVRTDSNSCRSLCRIQQPMGFPCASILRKGMPRSVISKPSLLSPSSESGSLNQTILSLLGKTSLALRPRARMFQLSSSLPRSSSIIYIRFQMKKLQVREEDSQRQKEKEESEESEELRDQPTQLEFVSKIKKKEAMCINYQGLFESATSQYPHSLSLMYTASADEGWKLTHGQNTGISQHAGHGDRGFVWNMPFEMTYQVKNPEGWPQMAIVLYGRDYMGRSVARGYGNFHLPAAEGSHARKVRIFEAVPPSTAATCCAYLMGYINQLKTPEKVLLGSESGRQYLRTRPIGEIVVRVQVRRYNFDKYGYE